MSGVTVRVDNREVAELVGGIVRRGGNLEPAMAIIGATVQASVQRNFESGGRPGKWAPLSPVTLKKKPNTKVLVVKGYLGGLLGSVHYEAGGSRVEIGTDKMYGAIHQFGGMAGRGRKVRIPARPFLLVQDEDWVEIHGALLDYYLGGKE
jgi:phage virion morphogenesis protein